MTLLTQMGQVGRAMRLAAGIASCAALLLMAVPSVAQQPQRPPPPPRQEAHRAPPPQPQWRGDIRRFHEHDWRVWRDGRWVNGRHDGRLGWWWVVGTFWYFYPAPVYPYPNPYEPPPLELAPPPAQFWYYCEALKSYYPYVRTCPGGWRQVPATPSDAPVGSQR